MKKCIECDNQNIKLYPICKRKTECYSDEYDLAKNKYVCENCLKEVYCEYAKCRLCSEDIAYNKKDLFENCGYYCTEHKDEVYDIEED